MRRLLVLSLALLAGCGAATGSLAGNPAAIPPVVTTGGTVVDRLTGAATCTVSADTAIWYTVPQGTFAPLDVVATACPGATLSNVAPPVPSWARPQGATSAIFVAASLVGSPGDGPIAPLAQLAHADGVPMTWLLDAPWTSADASAYDAAHASGDDVQVVPSLVAAATSTWPWYRPVVAPLGAGHERDIAGTLAAGERAFWGITWNSSGLVDRTADRGAPWGAYCADASSYKRPAPNGSCALLAFEWTARDLTAAYLTSREDAWSTDPDDLRLRAGLTPAAAAAYVQQIVDAYAAAGQTAPLVLVAQEEATEFAAAPDDATIEDALYRRARADGMIVTTMADAANRIAPFAAAPRAIAFPALAATAAAGPGTIDAHDTQVGLTFRAGETMPSRVFPYARAATSRFNVPDPSLAPSEMPSLTSASAAGGVLTLRFHAPVATRFGVAFWTDPVAAGWTSPNVVAAGRAGAVAFFDLAAGDDTVTLGCAACTSTTFPYAAGL